MGIVLQLVPASSRIPAWHTAAAEVHHTNAECLHGSGIAQGRRRGGTGGKPACGLCRRLDRIEDQLEGYTIPFRF